MQRERGWRTVIRSVLAVIAGIAVLTVTSFAIEWADRAGAGRRFSRRSVRRSHVA